MVYCRCLQPAKTSEPLSKGNLLQLCNRGGRRGSRCGFAAWFESIRPQYDLATAQGALPGKEPQKREHLALHIASAVKPAKKIAATAVTLFLHSLEKPREIGPTQQKESATNRIEHFSCCPGFPAPAA